MKLKSVLLFFFLLYSGVAHSANEAFNASSRKAQAFFEQVRAVIEDTLTKREGVVILMDRRAGLPFFLGDTELAQKKFLPGSLMKLITAETALRAGQVPPYDCTGRDRIGGKKMHCWTYLGHGSVDFSRALSLSCNLYFARLGAQLGAGPLLAALVAGGFPEAGPLAGKKWSSAQAAKLAIGDLPAFRVTPQETLEFWDRYLKKLSDPRLAPIAQALRRSVMEGTGRKAAGPAFEILGKTGTSDSLRSAYKTDGWFLGAYPAAEPRWALLVFLRQAHGFDEAAELAGRIFSLGVKTGYFEEN